MTSNQPCSHCGNAVKPALTRKRRRRHVENDEYADFPRRALTRLHPPHRAATLTPSRTSTRWSATSSRLAAPSSACATRLLQGRHRAAARRHPPGRPPTLGTPAMTPRGAAAAIAPEPEHGPGPVATADDVITFADLKDLGTAARQHRHLRAPRPAARPHRCHRPDHRRGRPGLRHRREPGGVLHVACGNRREAVCPACSAIYKRDARQLVRAGLAGGKGVPESVAAHPCVFATLTAPSFGPVHARRDARQDGAALPSPP